MKRCLACASTFSGASWSCPRCGFTPETLDGFLMFAPELAASNDGMAPDAHHRLEASQGSSFWFRARNRLIADMMTRHFPHARTVLEIGCGTGYALKGLQATLPSAQLTGSEIYVNGLSYARRRLGTDVDLFQMDARAIPFSEQFDVICAFDVIEHVDEDMEVLREMYGAVRPGGGIFLSVPQHPWLWSRTDEIAYHKRRYRINELSEKCQAAGFRIIRTTSFVTTLLPAMLAQRLLRGRKVDYNPCNEMRLHPMLDRAFDALLETERRLIASGLSLPVGGSRFVLAVRDA
jgi:SAM-dependent methyltransferase